MSFRKFLWAAALSVVLTGSAQAQNNQLRGLSQSTPNNLPSAQQQLNQSLNNQQSSFSTRQQIDSANRLNHTNQINRLNAQPSTTVAPCAGANSGCQNAQ
ncbi:hypothetical protein [Roseibium sp. SCP14]|uniref:hypothetical protein n=1 Tax=Roseibium sp. SCP14 TaxID=3141375 RepID=UPI0033399C28